MTNQIRIFLGFLGLIALVSVFTFFNSFRNSSSTFLKPLTGSALEAIDQDADKDGLTNREESYWNTDFQNPDTDGDGFLDGEEVASGHDPIKPGPDDMLREYPNLTEKVQTLVVGGLYSKDLKPDNANFESSVNSISAVIVDDFYQSQPAVQKPDLALITNSTENQEIYLKNVSEIVKRAIFTTGIGPNKDVDSYINGLINLKNNFQSTYQDLAVMPVPKDWQDIHYTLLNIIYRSTTNYEFVINYQSDPYRAYAAINELKILDDDVKKIIEQVVRKIDENHLVQEDNFYKLLNLFYR